jgi:hypothetical protein
MKLIKNAGSDRAIDELRETLAPSSSLAPIVGKKEELAVSGLFTPGGTRARKGEFQGINDFEVVAFLVVLPEGNGATTP